MDWRCSVRDGGINCERNTTSSFLSFACVLSAKGYTACPFYSLDASDWSVSLLGGTLSTWLSRFADVPRCRRCHTDLLKVRMQTAVGEKPTYTGTVKSILKQDGPTGLFRGLTARLGLLGRNDGLGGLCPSLNKVLLLPGTVFCDKSPIQPLDSRSTMA